ncbi:MAG: DUF3795 domain-containing protein [Acidobacteriota bacterium]
MKTITENMIAPCGVNCGVCYAHMRPKKTCPGCLSTNENAKVNHCIRCKIKLCEGRENTSVYCYDCVKFPCTRLKNLDKRYRTKYHTGLIANLEFVKHKGIKAFIKEEKKKWKCPHCGQKLCVHRDVCPNCGGEYLPPPTNQ